MAWLVLSARVWAVALADRQALFTAALMAREKVDLPDPDAEVEDLARRLAAPPVAAKPDAELRTILGVA